MSINNSSMKSIQYKLLGAECSMFTGKVRSYMRWKGIPFKEVTASDSVYKTIIVPQTGVAFMPTLLIVHQSTDGSSHWETVQDSKGIIDFFEKAFPPAPQTKPALNHAVVPRTPKRAFAAMMLEILSDEWVAIQGMFWRWGDGEWEQEKFDQQLQFLEFEFGNTNTGGRRGLNVSEIKETGRNVASFFRKVGATHLGITPETGPLFRKNFNSLLSLLSAHFEHHPFLLGSTVSLADFAFIGPFYAHLSRDPIPSFTIKTTAPLVWEWVERVTGLGRFAGKDVERWDAGSESFVSQYDQPSFLDDADGVPASMNAVARLLMIDYLPILTNAVAKTIEHLDSQPWVDEPLFLPRFLEHSPFHVSASSAAGAERTAGSAALQTHPVWMLQRILDRTYNTPEQKEAADAWIRDVGGDSVLKNWQDCVGKWIASGWHVGREKNKLVATRS